MTTANKLTILRVLMIPAFLVVLYWGFPGTIIRSPILGSSWTRWRTSVW